MPPGRGMLPSACAVAVACGVAARLLFLERAALGYDEAVILQWGRDGALELVRSVAERDAHPPLFYLLQLPFARLAEAGAPAALALRMLPALCGVLTLEVVRRAGRELAGPVAGALAAAFLALLPMHVHWSRTGRMYAPAALLLSLSLLFLLRAARSGRPRDAALLCLCALAACHTHYYALAVLPFLLLAAPGAPARLAVKAPLAVLFWGMLPWALLARSSPLSPHFAARVTNWLDQGGFAALLEGLRQLEFNPFFLPATPAVAALLLLAGLARRARLGDALPCRLVLACLLPGIALALLSVLLRILCGANALQPNHLALLSPLYALALAVTLDRARTAFARPLLALLLASAGLSLLSHEAGQAARIDAKTLAPLFAGFPVACPDGKSAVELAAHAAPARLRSGGIEGLAPGERAFARADTRRGKEAFALRFAPDSSPARLMVLFPRGECAAALSPAPVDLAFPALPPGFRLEVRANGTLLPVASGRVRLPAAEGIVEIESGAVAGAWFAALSAPMKFAFLAALLLAL